MTSSKRLLVRVVLPLRRLVSALAVVIVADCADSKEATNAAPKAKQPVSAVSFSAFECAAGLGADDYGKQLVKIAESLRSNQRSSYLIVRRRMASGPATIAERGALCSSFSNAADCKRDLAKVEDDLLANTACPKPPCLGGVYAIIEQEGKFLGFGDAPALARFLAPIDSAEEAWLIAQAHLDLPWAACGDVEGAAFRRVNAGYELRHRYASRFCEAQNPEISEAIILVDGRGAASTVRRSVVQPTVKPCVETPAEAVEFK